jgi:CheY-like chemotaxis protein
MSPDRPAHVLVVDDEQAIAEMVRDMLVSAGHRVTVASSGVAALQILGSMGVDAVLADVRMPGMDGIQFWREASRGHPSIARRFLFITGDTLSSDVRQFLAESACRRLEKPFVAEDLLPAAYSAREETASTAFASLPRLFKVRWPLLPASRTSHFMFADQLGPQLGRPTARRPSSAGPVSCPRTLVDHLSTTRCRVVTLRATGLRGQ